MDLRFLNNANSASKCEAGGLSAVQSHLLDEGLSMDTLCQVVASQSWLLCDQTPLPRPAAKCL